MTGKEVSAARAEGEPLFPVAEPGSAVSPGTRTCSFATSPGLTTIPVEVPSVMVPDVTSWAVIVMLGPALFSETELLNVTVPADMAALAGGEKCGSLDESETVSAEETGLKLASTACTVAERVVATV